MNKQNARIRRGLKTKAMLRQGTRPRLVVHRSNCHIYSQIVVPGEKGDVVLVASSTLDKELRPALKGSKKEKSRQVGVLLGERAKAKKILEVAFDRSGYLYFGCVAALAEGAREAGLKF